MKSPFFLQRFFKNRSKKTQKSVFPPIVNRKTDRPDQDPLLHDLSPNAHMIWRVFGIAVMAIPYQGRNIHRSMI